MDKKAQETIERYQKRKNNRIQIKKYKERRDARLQSRAKTQNKQDNSQKNTQFEQIYNLQQKEPSVMSVADQYVVSKSKLKYIDEQMRYWQKRIKETDNKEEILLYTKYLLRNIASLYDENDIISSGKLDDKWITVNGTHVNLSEEGTVTKGPAALKEHFAKKNNSSPKENKEYDKFTDELMQKYKAKNYSDLENKLRDANGDLEGSDPLVAEYFSQIGYLGKPQFKTADQIAKDINEGAIPVFRGIAATEDKSAFDIAYEFKHNENDRFLSQNNNAFGTGTYFDTNPEFAKLYSDGSFGSVIVGCLDKNAKVIGLDELTAKMNEESKKGKYMDADYGIAAAQLGYDAINLTGSSARQTHVVLLNKNKLVTTQSASLTPEGLEEWQEKVK